MNVLAAELEIERGAAGTAGFRLHAEFATGPDLTAILGPSGAGKSTLLMALLGALKPTRGRIRLDGNTLFDSTAGIDVPVRQRGIGIVFQDALLFPHLNARDNVAFGICTATARGVRLESERHLEQTGALALAERFPAELSGGERQRVALARALAARPRLLLLDEPFSALDTSAREALGALLVELQREQKIPFLHVTHDLSEALRLASFAVVIESGRTVACGRPQAVLSARHAFANPDWAATDNILFGRIRGADNEDRSTDVDLGGVIVRTAEPGLPPGTPVVLRLHAEDVLVAREAYHRSSARNVIPGGIDALRTVEGGIEVDVRISAELSIRALVTAAAVHDLELAIGQSVHLLFKATALRRIR